ncbi:hypothetical protein FV288_21780 [Escherichia coli]|nr:hypothetical protein [Escherichia coli]EFH8973689.1 hypothetical protein [Escherichia coli]EFL7414771.1 hypothetical protein [Escherichia coli]EFN4121856.1 hypothetical protein [Escherichia coli]EFN4267325.1 hypothetical protein [Escherichia coli]
MKLSLDGTNIHRTVNGVIYCICAGFIDGNVQNRIYIKRTSVPPNSLMKMSSENRKIFNFAVFLHLNPAISSVYGFVML